ncbi:DUF2313 domain-containing protein [Clostridium niameyense]|uniref:DUF2313 domain-containing protein n=1 Tax=Clostridium niameyense TaxID=1622073 RepID=A0A6M0RCP8_9CLOT|nr:DUF2313 domain-containing protein [Clostridium niameyense]
MQLKDYVPFFISKIKDIEQIYKAQDKELNKIKLDIKDLRNQCFVATATWGLDFWEEFLNIETDTSKSIQERRSNIFAKLRGQGTTTVEVIKQIAQAYADIANVTEDNPNYAFYINLESYKGYPFNLDSLYKNIEEIKPAHLQCNYKLTSTTKGKFRIGTITRYAETITVYPYNPREIELKGTIKLALGDSTGLENITVYPRKEGN